MDIYKVKFTVLEQEIIRFFFINSGKKFTGRAIAIKLKVSPTAVSNSIKNLKKEGLITIEKVEGGRLSIGLNMNNQYVFNLKRVENLKFIYESRLSDYLFENFPEATIILFGSYSFGEDTIDSDIDIAIIGSENKNINLDKYEKILEKKITINFYKNFKEIDKNLRENIARGIILKGGIELWS